MCPIECHLCSVSAGSVQGQQFHNRFNMFVKKVSQEVHAGWRNSEKDVPKHSVLNLAFMVKKQTEHDQYRLIFRRSILIFSGLKSWYFDIIVDIIYFETQIMERFP